MSEEVSSDHNFELSKWLLIGDLQRTEVEGMEADDSLGEGGLLFEVDGQLLTEVDVGGTRM
jgi:hypothetical protein